MSHPQPRFRVQACMHPIETQLRLAMNGLHMLAPKSFSETALGVCSVSCPQGKQHMEQ